METPNRSAPSPIPTHPAASDFSKRFPAQAVDPNARGYTDGYVDGPRHSWVCDGGSEVVRDGVLVCTPGDPPGTACAVRVYCRRHRPRRHQGYALDLNEFRDVPAAFDSLRQLLGKTWFSRDDARLLLDRFLGGLHVAPTAR